jgi:hypothetical protein
MIFKSTKFFVMLAFIVIGINQAHAQGNGGGGGGGGSGSPCDGLNISAQSALIDLNTQNMTPITIQVSRTGTGNCDFFITADNGPSATYLTRVIEFGTNSIPFQLYKDSGKSNILKSFTEASTANDVLVGSFNGNNTGPINMIYYPWVDTAYTAADGPYVESYGFYLYQGTIGAKASAVQRDNKSTNMKYQKSGFVELSLVDTGALYNAADTTQTLNFGNLATGAVRSFDLMLKYNGGYKLSMASLNGSNIKSGARLIPYTMTINSSGVALSTTPTIVRTYADDGGSLTSPSAGLRLPVSVTMGTVGSSPTGNYTDTVSISVASP